MPETMSRGQVQDLLSKFAIENPKYRQALINDPKGLIERQLNTSLGPTKVKAVVDTVDTVHVVIPYAAAEGELSDADLEKVAGGKQDIKASCDLKAGGFGDEQHGHQRQVVREQKHARNDESWAGPGPVEQVRDRKPEVPAGADQ